MFVIVARFLQNWLPIKSLRWLSNTLFLTSNCLVWLFQWGLNWGKDLDRYFAFVGGPNLESLVYQAWTLQDIYHPVPISWCQPDSHPEASMILSRVSFKNWQTLSQGRFFSVVCLPLEFHREIYNYVLGNHNIIQLVRSPDKLVQFSMLRDHKIKHGDGSPDKIVQSSTRQKQDQKFTSAWPDCFFKKKKKDLALLRTCRQI